MISLETSERKWASSLLDGRTSWIFSSCGRCSHLTTGTSGTRSGGLRRGRFPCELLFVLSGFLSRRCRGLRPCVELIPEPEDSSPVLTWILGDFWCLPRGVSPRLECGHARALSSRAVAAVSRFPSRGSRDLWLLSTYDWDLRDPLWWPQERPGSMRVARGPLGIPVPSMPGRKTLCRVGAGT